MVWAGGFLVGGLGGGGNLQREVGDGDIGGVEEGEEVEDVAIGAFDLERGEVASGKENLGADVG